MSEQGQVRIVLNADTSQAKAQIDAFFDQIKNQKTADPFKGLDKSFEGIKQKLNQLGVSWDQTTQKFKTATGAAVSVERLKDMLAKTVTTVDQSAKSFSLLGEKLKTTGTQFGSFGQKATGVSQQFKAIGSSASTLGQKITGLTQPANQLGVTLGKLGKEGGNGLKVVATNVGNLQGSFQKSLNTTAQFSQKLGQLGGASTTAGSSLKTISGTVAQLSSPVSTTSNAFGQLGRVMTQTATKAAPLRKIPASLVPLAQAATKPIGPLEKLKQKLQQTGTEGQKTGNLVSQGFKTIMQGIPTGIGMAIGNALIAPFRELAGVIPAAIKEFSELDGSIRLTLGILGESSDKFDRLQASILKVSSSSAATAQEVASIAQALARAGFSMSEIDDSLDAVVMGAEATGTAYGEMADIVASALGQFGLEAKQASRVVDVLTAAANSSNQTVGDLGEALKYVGPTAKAAGLSLESTALATTFLANAGIKGSTAGTSFARILTNLRLASSGASEEFTKLSRGSARLQKALRLIGADVTDTNGELMDTPELLKELQRSMLNLDPGERALVSKVLAGQEGLPALNVLLNATSDDIDEMADKLENSAGTAAKAQAQALAGLNGAFKLLNSQISASLAQIGAFIARALTPLIKAVTSVIGFLNNLPGPLKNIALAMAAAGIAVGGFVIALKTLTAVVGTKFLVGLISQVQGFTAALTAGGAIGAITTFVSSIKAMAAATATGLISNLDKLTKGFTAFNKAVASGEIINGFKTAMAGLGSRLTNIRGVLTGTTKGMKVFDHASSVAALSVASTGNAAATAAKSIKVVDHASSVTALSMAKAASSGGKFAGAFATAAASIGNFMNAVGPTAVVLGSIALAVGGLVSSWSGASEAAKKFEGANSELKDELEDIKATTERLTGEQQKLEVSEKRATTAAEVRSRALSKSTGIQNIFNMEVKKAWGFINELHKQGAILTDQLKSMDKSIEATKQAMKGMTRGSAEYLEASDNILNIEIAKEKAMKSHLEAIKGELTGTNQLTEAGKLRANALEIEKQKVEEALGKQSKRVDVARRERQALEDLKGANSVYKESLTTVANAYDTLTESIDRAVQAKEIENSAAVISGLKSEEEAVASNANARLLAIKKKISGAETYLTKIKGMMNEEGADRDKLQKAIDDQNSKLMGLYQDRIKAEKEATDATKAAVNARLDEYMREVDAIASQYEKLGSIFSNLSNIGQGGLSAFKSLADSITNMEISGINKTKQERTKAIEANKQQALKALEARKAQALAMAGEEGDARTRVEKQFDAQRKAIENDFNRQKRSAEQRAANERKAVMAKQIKFEQEYLKLKLEAGRQQIEMETMLAQVANERAIQENKIAILKAEAAGAPEAEIDALRRIGGLLEANKGVIALQGKAQQDILGIQALAEQNQLAAKANQEGLTGMVQGTGISVDQLAGKMKEWQRPINEAKQRVADLGGGFAGIPDRADQVFQDVKRNIEGTLGEVSFESLDSALASMDIPPQVRERIIATIDDSLLKGGQEGAESFNRQVDQMNISEEAKERLKRAVKDPIEQAGTSGLQAMGDVLADLPDQVPTDEVKGIIQATFDDGSVEGKKAFEEKMRTLGDTIPKEELIKMLMKAVKDGGENGAQAFEETMKLAKGGEESDAAVEGLLNNPVKL